MLVYRPVTGYYSIISYIDIRSGSEFFALFFGEIRLNRSENRCFESYLLD